jgi:hypothetical protein
MQHKRYVVGLGERMHDGAWISLTSEGEEAGLSLDHGREFDDIQATLLRHDACR